jgi:hypothetical protein
VSEPLLLLLSTPNGIWHFDSQFEELRRLSAGRPEYYGISWNDGGLVLSHSLDDNALPWISGDADRQDRFGICCQHAIAHEIASPRELLHPHQIECADERVVIANTGRNAIALWHPASGVLVNTHLVASRWDGLEPGTISLHLNSVHVQDRLLYAVAHNGSLPSGVWVYRWPDMELHAVFSTSTRWAHNAWHSGALAGLLICDSKAGTLHCVDYGEAVWTASTPATLTRGLAATPDVIVVGLSEFTPRAERATSNGGFAIIDRTSFRTVTEYWFEGIGNVHEVRVLSEPDECHTSRMPGGTARAWIDAAAAACDRIERPIATVGSVMPPRDALAASPPSLPRILEYGGGAGMAADVLAPGVAHVRTERAGDSNLVVASIAAQQLPPGALLHARGSCAVKRFDGAAYGMLRLCFRDDEGNFLSDIEIRSAPVGLSESRHSWFDLACIVPSDPRIAGIDVLWLQSGLAEIELQGLTIDFNPLPGSLRRATSIPSRLDQARSAALPTR